MNDTPVKKFERASHGYLFALGGVALATAGLAPFHDRLSSTTVALTLLLVVLFAAARWGSRPAMFASVLGVLCFNFFFLPPVHNFTIADAQNWVALAVFLITSVTAGELSARVKQRAEQAEADRREIERLYHEYRLASEKAKQAEVFEQGERLKSALLDAVTHDLRTPLTSIKASVTTLLSEEPKEADAEPVTLDAESRREFLEIINEESDRLNRFVESMVELARLEAGALQLRRGWSAVEEIVTMALGRSAGLTGRHAIEVHLDGELPVVRADAHLLAEVLYSLIDNATKYSPPGTRINVAARRADAEMIELAVEDEGRGIPPELRERVFDKFFRATSEGAASLGRPTGLGLGLAIARGIIEAHGGRIRIESGARGAGARIAFTVPIGDEENPGN